MYSRILEIFVKHSTLSTPTDGSDFRVIQGLNSIFPGALNTSAQQAGPFYQRLANRNKKVFPTEKISLVGKMRENSVF